MTMTKSPTLLLVGKSDEDFELLLDAPEISTVSFIDDDLNAEKVGEAAKSLGASGILASSAEALEVVTEAAKSLGLPSVPTAALGPLLSRGRFLETMQCAGVPVAPFCQISDPDDAPPDAVPPPWRVVSDRFSSTSREHFVAHAQEIPLAHSMVAGSTSELGTTLESDLPGQPFTLCGFQGRDGFKATALLHHGDRHDNGTVTMSLALSEPSSYAQLKRAETMATDALTALGIDSGMWEFEFVEANGNVYVTHLHPVPVPSRCVRTVLECGGRHDVVSQALNVAVGIAPKQSTQPYVPAALHWLMSHSGSVKAIERVNEAKSLSGVKHVRVFVSPGDSLGHILNRPTRDALGYVVATGANEAEAIACARDAAQSVHIVTSALA